MARLGRAQPFKPKILKALQSSGGSIVSGAGTIGLSVAVSGAGIAVFEAKGTITVTVGVAGVGVAQKKAAGAVGLQIGVAGAAKALAKTKGAVGLSIAVAGASSASQVVSGAGSVGLSLGVQGVGQVANRNDGEIPLSRKQRARLLEQDRKRREEIEAGWALRNAETAQLRDEIRRAAGWLPPEAQTVTPQTGTDDEDEEIELLLLQGW